MQQGIKTLLVVGVGLIGGSFALGLKRAQRVERIIGVDRSMENLQRALALGIIDEMASDLAGAVAQADMVLLATPVGQLPAVLAEMAPVLRPGTLLSDVGSTKANVLAALRQYLPDQLAYCVPAHPIAGSERSGAQAASAGLFEQRDVILTPLPETGAEALACVSQLWQACGAEVQEMTAAGHDQVFAVVSHVPHLLAFNYVDWVAARDDVDSCLNYAATGFRDFTRLAGSSAEMWRDIGLANQASLLTCLREYRGRLDQLIQLIEQADGHGLYRLMSEARQLRGNWYQRFRASGK